MKVVVHIPNYKEIELKILSSGIRDIWRKY